MDTESSSSSEQDSESASSDDERQKKKKKVFRNSTPSYICCNDYFSFSSDLMQRICFIVMILVLFSLKAVILFKTTQG